MIKLSEASKAEHWEGGGGKTSFYRQAVNVKILPTTPY